MIFTSSDEPDNWKKLKNEFHFDFIVFACIWKIIADRVIFDQIFSLNFISIFYFSKHICLNPILSRSAVILANLSSAIGEIGDRTGPISIPWIYFIIDLFTWSLNPYWNIISRTWVKRVWRSDACSFLFAFTSIVIDRFYSNSNNYSYGLMSFTIVIIMANWSFEGQKYFD